MIAIGKDKKHCAATEKMIVAEKSTLQAVDNVRERMREFLEDFKKKMGS